MASIFETDDPEVQAYLKLNVEHGICIDEYLEWSNLQTSMYYAAMAGHDGCKVGQVITFEDEPGTTT